MKVYFLRFGHNSVDSNTINLTQDGNRWVTPLIDLYDNDSYRNYSVTKSNYGLGGTEYQWIGLTDTSTGEFLTVDQITGAADVVTDSGFRSSGRFVDTTGRIDVVSIKIVSPQLPSLDIYNSDLNDDTYYQDEWEKRGPFTESEEFNLIDSGRYIKFSFDFGLEVPSNDFEAYVRVEIDRAVMAPLYRFTREIADQFPEWMAMHNQPEEGDERELATPNSIGMKFINAVASEWLDDISREINYRDFQKYIGTVDLEQLAWDYEVDNIPEHVYSIKGDGVELARTHDYTEYLKMRTEDACFIDVNNDVVYTINEYDQLTINGQEFNQRPHQVWNYVDEIGMLVDLPRLQLEGNDSYSKRIRDVFINRGGVGVESLKLALRRELDLWRYEGATPDSAYVGATPEILEMEDLERERKYFAEDGMPTQVFVELIEKLSRDYPTTWGRFIWNRAIWDVAGQDNGGYGVVPYRYDVPLPPAALVQSGVGDGDDLFVFRPDTFTGPRDFNATLKMRGRTRTTRNEYRPVSVRFSIQGSGDRDFYEHPQKTVWYTVRLTTNEATPTTWLHSFQLSATSDVDNGNAEATPESWSYYQIFSDDGSTTREDIEFVHPSTNEPYDATGILNADDIDTVELIQGQWIAGTFQDLETQDHFEAWFSHNEVIKLTNSAPDGVGIGYTWTADATPFLPQSYVVMKSLQTLPPTAGTWYTDEFFFEPDINTLEPYLAEQPVTIDIPTLIWDQYTTNRVVTLKMLSKNPYNTAAEEHGGTTTDQDDNVYFVPAADIDITDDSATPATQNVDANGELTLADTVTAVTLAVPSGTIENSLETIAYPISTDIWTAFEESFSPAYAGVVDENGPWRNGVAPLPGNSNYILTVYDSLTRNDFGIPNNDDWVVTWVGVDTDNSRTIVWLDTNTVQPVNQDDTIEYPENSVVEDIDGGVYIYSPVVVRARIKPEPDPQWYPQVHSGYFYENGDEYYLYAKSNTETTAGSDLVLSEVARQGAPVIAQTDEDPPTEMRQVAFFDESATPVSLSLTNTEYVSGTGGNNLYVAYDDVYDVTVEDEDGNDVSDGPGAITKELVPAEHVELWGYAGDNSDVTKEPLFVDLESWGSSAALLLPGATDNYVNVPNVNLLKGNTANTHSGLGNWIAGTNANAPTLVDFQPRFGDNHLQWTASASGSCVIHSGNSGGLLDNQAAAVTGNTQYSFSVEVNSRSGNRDMVASVDFYSSGGSHLGSIDGVAEDVGTGWTRIAVTGMSMATSAWAIPSVTVSNAQSADTYWLDKASFNAGNKTTWTPSTILQGDLDIRVKYVPRVATSSGTLISKWTGTTATNTLALHQDVNGRVQLKLSNGAINSVGGNDTGTPVTARVPNVVRATWDKSGQLATIYSSANEGQTWNSEDTYATSVAALSETTQSLAYGAENSGGANLNGAILWAEIRDGIDGPIVASIDFGDEVLLDSQESWLTPEQSTATVIRGAGTATAEIVNSSCWYFIGTERLTIFDNVDLDATGQFEVLARAKGNNSGSEMVVISKKQTSTGTDVGWTVASDASGAALARARNASTAFSNTTGNLRDGQSHLVGLSRESDDSTYLILDGVAAQFGSDVTGDLSNGVPMVVGASNADAHRFAGIVYWFAFFNAPKTPEERADLASWTGDTLTEPEWLPYDEDAVLVVSASNITVQTYYTDIPNVYAYRRWDVSPGSVRARMETDYDSTYKVTYKANHSFYVDNDYVHADGTQRSHVVFDAPPPGGSNYVITYETAEYDPATPVDVPLNSLYTTQTDGFLYISFNEYTLESIRVHLSPHKVLADGVDYILVSINSFDANGNPKPNQTFSLSTDFGTLEDANLTTDQDGFATTILQSSDVFSASTGTLDITGDVSASIDFEIEEAKTPEPFLYAVAKSEQIQADGESKNLIYGRVQNADFTPVSGVDVNWKRARSIYELFTDTDIYDSGTVTTDTDGSFEIGPLTAQSNEDTGYWFLAAEATVSSIDIGDVVFWYEFPETVQGVENVDGYPHLAMQLLRSANEFPEYGENPVNQYKYKEDELTESATPSIVWSPPEWYAVSAYKNWKFGLNSGKNYLST